jgi:pimeloyl-ACP methyl ester carboxylesterase
MMPHGVRVVAARALLLVALGASGAWAEAPAPPRVGVVVMHGKGGSPEKHVAELAAALEAKACLVASLEMPWSRNRQYDVSVEAAEREVDAALAGLRDRGAKTLIVAGHSQGGLFALYFAGRHPVDGVVAIAPGGSVDGPAFRDKVADSVARARALVAEGKGGTSVRLLDYEGSRGAYPIVTTPAAYLGWFDPDGAMSAMRAVRAMSPRTPVLYVAPTGDYPALRRVKQLLFDALPRHPLTRLHEPAASRRRRATR